VYAQASLPFPRLTKAVYRPRGINAVQLLFKRYFQSIAEQYESKYAVIYGRFRIERVTKVVEKFVLCGLGAPGLLPGGHPHPAHRVKPCTNPDCKYEYFRPFSCKGFYFCPSCSQKRTLLFSEYMNERLLLNLPHRQFVWTIPRILRPYFRHNRRLFSEISRLIFVIIQNFYNKASNRSIKTGMVLAYQTSGEFFRWNPHWHAIVLEGGFDEAGRFVHIPLGNLRQDVRIFSPGDHQVLLRQRAYQCQVSHQLDQLEALRFFGRLCELELGGTFTYNSQLIKEEAALSPVSGKNTEGSRTG